MKRILASCVLAGLIVAISVGCGGETKSTTTTTKPATPGAKDTKMETKTETEKKK